MLPVHLAYTHECLYDGLAKYQSLNCDIVHARFTSSAVAVLQSTAEPYIQRFRRPTSQFFHLALALLFQ